MLLAILGTGVTSSSIAQFASYSSALVRTRMQVRVQWHCCIVTIALHALGHSRRRRDFRQHCLLGMESMKTLLTQRMRCGLIGVCLSGC